MAVNAASAGWSQDGNWYWDGQRWNEAVSADGRWRFDGSAWQPFAGERTPMPAPIPPPPPPPPPASPAPAPAAAMPSWVASSELERLEGERQERLARAAEPVLPLPPEQDWRRAGEFIHYSHTPSTPFWRAGGYTSLFIYLGLLWLCSPVALVYIWTTRWSIFTKLYRSVVALFFVSALAEWIRRHYGL